MPDRSPEDIINEPIKADDFKDEDFPSPEEDQLKSPDDEDIDLDDELNIGDEEIDPVGDDALGLGDDEFSDELNDMSLDLPDEEPISNMVAPEEQIRWTPVPQENGDIWSEHVDGFVLRARPLSAQQGSKIKYAAQLFKNDKLIEKGVIYIDQNRDSREVLQNIADRILDRLNLVNMSKQEAQPEMDLELPAEEAETAIEAEEAETQAGEDLEDLEELEF